MAVRSPDVFPPTLAGGCPDSLDLFRRTLGRRHGLTFCMEGVSPFLGEREIRGVLSRVTRLRAGKRIAPKTVPERDLSAPRPTPSRPWNLAALDPTVSRP
mgnify:CR=1 FL=1|jgi:O-methyltransferase involved in polyketide biosynthesis